VAIKVVVVKRVCGCRDIRAVRAQIKRTIRNIRWFKLSNKMNEKKKTTTTTTTTKKQKERERERKKERKKKKRMEKANEERKNRK
jgi:hypothetical protein